MKNGDQNRVSTLPTFMSSTKSVCTLPLHLFCSKTKRHQCDGNSLEDLGRSDKGNWGADVQRGRTVHSWLGLSRV